MIVKDVNYFVMQGWLTLKYEMYEHSFRSHVNCYDEYKLHCFFDLYPVIKGREQ